MASTKTRSGTAAWENAMRHAFSRVEYEEAASIFAQAVHDNAKPSVDATLLHARTLLKLDAKDAVPFLLRHAPPTKNTAALGRWHLYLAIGFSRLRDFKEADEHFDAAEGLLDATHDRAELAYQRARQALLGLDTDVAWKHAASTEVDASTRGKIRSEHLRSFIYAQDERYRDQARSLVHVLDLIADKRTEMLEEWYAATHTLAVLARELAMPEIWARAEAEVNMEIVWAPHYRTSYFQAIKAIGWCRALQGDSLGCFRYLRHAQKIAPSPAFMVIVLLDRAYFANTLGEAQWAQNELAAAEDLAAGVSWEDTTGEERVGLLLLAQLVAPASAKRARYYLARFQDLGRIRSNVHHYAFDKRLDAIAALTSGVVTVASDDAKAAIEQFREAWATFDRIAYDWRAAHTAMYLYRVSGKARWKLLAEEKLEAYPSSWIAGDLQKEDREGPTRISILSPAQERVFRLICAGRSTKQICEDLQRADNTVRNHVKAIFKAFDVNSRAALVAQAVQRGLIGPSH